MRNKNTRRRKRNVMQQVLPLQNNKKSKHALMLSVRKRKPKRSVCAKLKRKKDWLKFKQKRRQLRQLQQLPPKQNICDKLKKKND